MYSIYNVKIANIEDIEDLAENVIISPEIYSKGLKNYKFIQKGIWWLGVQYYDGFDTLDKSFKSKSIRFLKRVSPTIIWKTWSDIKSLLTRGLSQNSPFIPDNDTLHLCGSKFAYDYVVRYFGKGKMLVEPIGKAFLNNDDPTLSACSRKDLIVYNPAKPSKLQNQLLDRDDLNFVPIRNLNTPQMIKLFRESKLYIDFGYFGGPERLPKETVINGTLLLVGKRNASINDFDIAIPTEYKLDNIDNIDDVVEKIKYMINNYDNLINDFSSFRSQIRGLENQFIRDLESIFKRNV